MMNLDLNYLINMEINQIKNQSKWFILGKKRKEDHPPGGMEDFPPRPGFGPKDKKFGKKRKFRKKRNTRNTGKTRN